MAELNLDYYTAKDHYSDGDIEETLLKMAQEGKSFEDLPEDEVSFPMVYHFSGLRENILSWYPLKETDSVLEIGAGCGAITGMLCRKAGHVTSVELSKRRADINYARTGGKTSDRHREPTGTEVLCRSTGGSHRSSLFRNQRISGKSVCAHLFQE